MSSKYYDPKKAHEYYEEHKKLKGRTSTKGFTQRQKELAAYAKHQINEDKKVVLSGISDRAKEERRAFTVACQEKVKQLREKLKRMPKEQRASAKERINDMIAQVKNFYKDQKANTTEHAKDLRQQTKEQFNGEYQKAIQDIRARG